MSIRKELRYFVFIKNSMKNIRLIMLSAGFCLLSSLVPGQCVVQDISFRHGEKITYEISYNWGFIWVDAGVVYFKADTLKFNQTIVYSFEAFGTTHHQYDWFFKVRDIYQSKLDPVKFQPLWFQKKIYEGGTEIFNQYDFDTASGQISMQVKKHDKQLITTSAKMENCRFDVLSACYYARSIDFNNFLIGDTIPLKIIIDDTFYETFIRFQGRETIESRNGDKYRCIKLSAMLIEGTIFKGGEDLVVWITDDQNKIPVMAESKLWIGSVKAYLTRHEGLKYPLESEVKD